VVVSPGIEPQPAPETREEPTEDVTDAAPGGEVTGAPGETTTGEYETLVLDEDDQLPLSAEEIDALKSAGHPLPEGVPADSTPVAAEVGEAPASDPVEAAPAVASPEEPVAEASEPRAVPPPPSQAVLQAATQQQAAALAAQQQAEAARAAAEAARVAAEAARAAAEAERNAPWYTRLFDRNYLKLLKLRSHNHVAREVSTLVDWLKLPQGATILDLACGDGAHAIELGARGYRVVGLDLSETFIDEAARRAELVGSSAKFVRGDMRGLSSNGRFDAVLCLGTSFGYFEDAANVRVLKAVSRALRSGGRFVLAVANRDVILAEQPVRVWHQVGSQILLEETEFDHGTSQLVMKRQIAFANGRQQEEQVRIRLYSLHELWRLLEAIGLEVVETSGATTFASPFLGHRSRQIVLVAHKVED